MLASPAMRALFGAFAGLTTAASLGGRSSTTIHHGISPKFIENTGLAHFSADAADAGVQYNQNWAGAVLMGTNLTTVSALVKIPSAAMPPGGRATVQYSTTTWVGIDGVSCATQALLQAGVDTFVQNGNVRFEGWYEWYPQPSIPFPNFAVKLGDVINITVGATSTTTGYAILENLTTGKSVNHVFTNGARLCFKSAEWIVEDFSQGNQMVAFANFTTVTFTNATAKTGDGKVLDNTGSQIFGIMQRNKIYTECATPSSSTVECKYVGA